MKDKKIKTRSLDTLQVQQQLAKGIDNSANPRNKILKPIKQEDMHSMNQESMPDSRLSSMLIEIPVTHNQRSSDYSVAHYDTGKARGASDLSKA